MRDNNPTPGLRRCRLCNHDIAKTAYLQLPREGLKGSASIHIACLVGRDGETWEPVIKWMQTYLSEQLDPETRLRRLLAETQARVALLEAENEDLKRTHQSRYKS